MKEWTKWNPMPEPAKCLEIKAPENAGVYQVRHKGTGQFILFGEGGQCQERMKSLYPKPYGKGTRNNASKRQYVLENWENLEYRTLEADDKQEAVRIDRQLKAQNNHLFNT